MTLKRLMIITGILVLLASIGIAWLWEYAYTPQGRARVIIAQLKGDTTLRGWMLKYQLIRPGFSEPTSDEGRIDWWERGEHASDEMIHLDRKVLPIVIEALQDDDWGVRIMAIQVCGKLRDPAAISPLIKCMLDPTGGVDTQTWCAESLIKIGPEAHGRLIEASANCCFGTREAIISELAKERGEAAVPLIAKFLDDSDIAVRTAAVDELRKLKEKRAANALEKLVVKLPRASQPTTSAAQ